MLELSESFYRKINPMLNNFKKIITSKESWIRLSIIPIVLVSFELMLRIGTSKSFFSGNLFFIMLYTASLGFLFSAIQMLFIKKIRLIFSFVLYLLVSIYFLIVFFSQRAFGSFFDLKSLMFGAGGVVEDFGGDVLNTIKSGIGTIIIFLLPALVVLGIILIRRTRKKNGLKTRSLFSPLRSKVRLFHSIVAIFVCVALFLVARVTTRIFNEKNYSDNFTFNVATEQFGLLTSTRISLNNSSNESEFITADEVKAESDLGLDGSSYAQGEADSLEEGKVYEDQVLDIDFEELAVKEKDPELADFYSFVAQRNPTKENEYTGIFKDKNLIMICAEAFDGSVVSEELTPTLYRMATKGIQMNEFYQPTWGGSTSSGEYSLLMGLIPTSGVLSMVETQNNNLWFTLGNQLREQGYQSQAYHVGTHDFYDRHLTHNNIGYDEFLAFGNGLEKIYENSYGSSDKELIANTLPLYIDADKFSTYIMAYSGHSPYDYPNKYTEMYMDIIEEYEPLKDAPATIKNYYCKQYALEDAMSYLISELERVGIADDTVIAMCTDHYPYGLEEGDTWGNDQDYIQILKGLPDDYTVFERDRDVGFIWCGSLEDMDPIIVDTPTSSLDFVPTLANLFDIPFDSRLFAGRDMLAPDSTPIVTYSTYSWISEHGYYDVSNKDFTPKLEDVIVLDQHIELMNAEANNQNAISAFVLNNDLYGILEEKGLLPH